MNALAPLQQAIYTRLNNDGPLAALGFGVYDEPPGGGQSDRYVAIGEATEVRGGITTTESQSHDSRECTETLHVWTKGFSTLACKQGMALVCDALESTPLAVTDWGMGTARCEFSTFMRDKQHDEMWRHGVLRFRVVVGRVRTAS
jgi:hypothetical protein